MKVICKLWRKAGDCPLFIKISYERFKNFLQVLCFGNASTKRKGKTNDKL